MGDTAQMVRARADFLASGIYEPIAQRLVEAIQARLSTTEPHLSTTAARPHRPYLMADLGGGTGWYSAYILDSIPDLSGILVDASAQAAKVAARAHPRLSVATADLWKRIPIADASVDIATVIFAPRNPDEIRRILVPSGVCLVVTPGPNHLAQLRETYSMLTIEPEKERRLAEQFAQFYADKTSSIEYHRPFSPQDIATVIAMGPSAFHRDTLDATDLEPTDVTISVTLHQFIAPPHLPL